MQRNRISVRPDWIARVEELGLSYHSHEEAPYWDESVFYEFDFAEITQLEEAAAELHRICLEAAGAIMENGWWSRLKIPATAVEAIQESWENDQFSIYGRFDVAYDGKGPPKMLEYNADTPTSLVEASVIQWFWLQEQFPKEDQFNSIHEQLIQGWKHLGAERIYFSSLAENPEDEQTVRYLQDTCVQAGHLTSNLSIEKVGWNEDLKCFVDLDENAIDYCFKLYPWEWMWREEFGKHLVAPTTAFIEPAWKMLLSNKAILPILWELFPDHPNLLPAYETPEPLRGTFVKKPILSREGANVQIVANGNVLEENMGDYGMEGFIYQAHAPVACLENHYPILGLWMIHHEAAGLGIRESNRRITHNLSRFVPHLIR